MRTIQKLITLCFIIALTSLVAAQTEQGGILISGSSGFVISGGSSKFKSDDFEGDPTKSFSFGFSPAAGYFIIDNLAIGAQIPFWILRSKSSLDYVTTLSSFSFAPFARYYFLSGNIKPFGHAAIGGGIEGYKTKDPDGNTDKDNESVFLMYIGGGAALFLNEKVAVEAALNYEFSRSKPRQDNDNNMRDVDHDVSFAIGITVIL